MNNILSPTVPLRTNNTTITLQNDVINIEVLKNLQFTYGLESSIFNNLIKDLLTYLSSTDFVNKNYGGLVLQTDNHQQRKIEDLKVGKHQDLNVSPDKLTKLFPLIINDFLSVLAVNVYKSNDTSYNNSQISNLVEQTTVSYLPNFQSLIGGKYLNPQVYKTSNGKVTEMDNNLNLLKQNLQLNEYEINSSIFNKPIFDSMDEQAMRNIDSDMNNKRYVDLHTGSVDMDGQSLRNIDSDINNKRYVDLHTGSVDMDGQSLRNIDSDINNKRYVDLHTGSVDMDGQSLRNIDSDINNKQYVGSHTGSIDNLDSQFIVGSGMTHSDFVGRDKSVLSNKTTAKITHNISIDNITNIVNESIEKISNFKHNEITLKIHLSSSDMLSVNVKLQNNTINVIMDTNNANVCQFISSNIDVLKQHLQTNNFNLGAVSINIANGFSSSSDNYKRNGSYENSEYIYVTQKTFKTKTSVPKRVNVEVVV